MLTKNINLKNFHLKKINKKVKQDLKKLLKEKSTILDSLSTNYKNSYSKKNILNSQNYKNIRVIGMGGSTLGTESIYDFLKHKIKKKLTFYDNLTPNLKTLSKNFVFGLSIDSSKSLSIKTLFLLLYNNVCNANFRSFLFSFRTFTFGLGPKITPPPFHRGERLDPARAWPVPFCFQGLRPPPRTSLLVFVEEVDCFLEI